MPPDWVRPSGSTDRASPVPISGDSYTTRSQDSDGKRVVSPSIAGSPPIPGANKFDEHHQLSPELRIVGTSFPSSSNNNLNLQPSSPTTKTSGTRYTGGGGVQVVLDGSGPWDDLSAGPNSTPLQQGKSKPSGMLGFLSKRRGRASSPKPQERGVLGKEGSRVVVA